MNEQDRLVSDGQPVPNEQVQRDMRELTLEELREVVGGPEIKNGGGGDPG